MESFRGVTFVFPSSGEEGTLSRGSCRSNGARVY